MQMVHDEYPQASWRSRHAPCKVTPLAKCCELSGQPLDVGRPDGAFLDDCCRVTACGAASSFAQLPSAKILGWSSRPVFTSFVGLEQKCPADFRLSHKGAVSFRGQQQQQTSKPEEARPYGPEDPRNTDTRPGWRDLCNRRLPV